MGPKGCPETSVTIYQPTIRKIPEQRSYHVHRLLPLLILKEDSGAMESRM